MTRPDSRLRVSIWLSALLYAAGTQLFPAYFTPLLWMIVPIGVVVSVAFSGSDASAENRVRTLTRANFAILLMALLHSGIASAGLPGWVHALEALPWLWVRPASGSGKTTAVDDWTLSGLSLCFLFAIPFLVFPQKMHLIVADYVTQVQELGIFDGRFRGSFFPFQQTESYYLPGSETCFYLNRILLDRFVYQVFGFVGGHVVNDLIVRMIAFGGLFGLLHMWIHDKRLRFLVAVSFASLPFFPGMQASVAGIPLFLLLIKRMRKTRRPYRIGLMLVAMCFYSRVELSGVFLMILFGTTILVRLFRGKTVKRDMISAGYLTAGWTMSAWLLMYIMFFLKTPNIRQSLDLGGLFGIDFAGVAGVFWTTLTRGILHTHSFHNYLILPVTFVWIAFSFRSRTRVSKLTRILFAFNLAAAALFAVLHWKPLMSYLFTELNIGLNPGRFVFLSPAAWYMLWGLSLAAIMRMSTRKRWIGSLVLILALLQVSFLWYRAGKYRMTKKVSFVELSAVPMFRRAERDLNLKRQDTRIGCYGFSPAIALYNGFRTVGAYSVVYPQHVKDEVFEIIEPELRRNPGLTKHYRKWGGVCYLFWGGMSPRERTRLDCEGYITVDRPVRCLLNTEGLQRKGVRYLFSTLEIGNYRDRGWTHPFRYRDKRFPYPLFVYDTMGAR